MTLRLDEMPETGYKWNSEKGSWDVITTRPVDAHWTEQLRMALEKLLPFGERTTPDEVAKGLETLGIKAVMCASDQCALAKYLTATIGTPDGYEWRVSSDIALMRHDTLGKEMKPMYMTRVETPEVFVDFICNFDTHLYPGLVEKS